jgi:iron complex outermembrane recepter protein
MRTTRLLSRSSLIALGVALALPAAAPALAQDKPGSEGGLALEEIIVTARKIEENLMTVPLAITAFSSKDIEAQGIKQLNDVMLMTPSFNFVNQQGGSGRNDRSANALVFRGLFLAGNVGTNAGGNLFIDGAPVLGAQPPAIVDVDRIEVLKGPQSAYFGRSTFAGAINFVTRDPSAEFKAKVSAEASSYGSHDYSIAAEGPLFTEKLRGRLAYRNFERGGQFINNGPTGGRLGEQTSESLSLTMTFQPTENFKAKLYANSFEDDDGPPAQGALKTSEFAGRVAGDLSCVPFSVAAAGAAATVNGVPDTSITSISQAANGRPSFGYNCGKLPDGGDLPANFLSGDYDMSLAATRSALFTPNPNWLVFDPTFKQNGGIRRVAWQADLRMDWTLGGYTISSLTANHRDKTQTIIDLNYRDGHNRVNPNYSAATAATRVPWQQFLLLSQTKLRDWSQELRVASPSDHRFRWMLGGNYVKLFSPGGTVYGMTPIGPLFTAAITQQDVETPAAFGAGYFDFTDKLTLSAEARYQWDKVQQTPKVGTNGQPITTPIILKNTFTSFSPRISLDYKFAPNSTFYVLFSRGTRPGGFNAGLVTSTQATLDALRLVVPNAGISFDQEVLENWEAGFKATWLDGRARTTVTVYSDKWINGQVANNVPVTIQAACVPPAVPPPGSTTCPIANLIGLTVNNGTASLDGIEFEGSIRATTHLTLSGTFGFNDTKIKTYGLGLGNCSDCNVVYGNFAGAIGHRLPTTPLTTWSLSGEYNSAFSNGLKWYARADFQQQGSKYTDFSNAAKVGEKSNLNARYGIRGEKWSAEVFGTNLTDDDTPLAGLLGVDVFTFLIPPNKNEVRFSPGLPRMGGVRVTYDF